MLGRWTRVGTVGANGGDSVGSRSGEGLVLRNGLMILVLGSGGLGLKVWVWKNSGLG